MQNNYYDTNYGSLNQGLIDISGFSIINLKNETFINNGESGFEILENINKKTSKLLIISDYDHSA